MTLGTTAAASLTVLCMWGPTSAATAQDRDPFIRLVAAAAARR